MITPASNLAKNTIYQLNWQIALTGAGLRQPSVD